MPIDYPMRFADIPYLWTIPSVYSSEECAQFIAQIESASPQSATNNPMYRNQDRVIVDDPTAAETLFARLGPHLPAQMGPFELKSLNERLRMYRYTQGQQFTPHMDHWYKPTPTSITLLTVLVYFNNDFVGGETRFMEQLEETITPAPGLVAVFQHKLRHEGCLVQQGRKYAMRTDVIYEAPDTIGILLEDDD